MARLGSMSAPSAPDAPRSETVAPAARPWWAQRRSWWELFLQFFAVALGVAAATGVGTWREQRNLRVLEQHALQGIANEVAGNRAHLEGRRNYYAAVAAEIEEALQAKQGAAELKDLRQFRGFNPLMLRRSAFEVSQQSRAFGRLDFQKAEQIAMVYALQDWVLSGTQMWMYYVAQHSSGMLLPPPELGRIMRDWAGMCDELLRAYDSLQPVLPAPLSVGAGS